jgi:hypothetical protein
VLAGVAALAAACYFVVYKKAVSGYLGRQGSGFKDLEAELTNGAPAPADTLGDTNTALVRAPSPASVAQLTVGAERQL